MEEIICVMAETGKRIRIGRIENNMVEIKKFVGGDININRLHDNISVISNKNGRLKDLAPSVLLMSENNKIDYIAGNALFLGQKENGFIGLNPFQVSTILKQI